MMWMEMVRSLSRELGLAVGVKFKNVWCIFHGIYLVSLRPTDTFGQASIDFDGVMEPYGLVLNPLDVKRRSFSPFASASKGHSFR